MWHLCLSLGFPERRKWHHARTSWASSGRQPRPSGSGWGRRWRSFLLSSQPAASRALQGTSRKWTWVIGRRKDWGLTTVRVFRLGRTCWRDHFMTGLSISVWRSAIHPLCSINFGNTFLMDFSWNCWYLVVWLVFYSACRTSSCLERWEIVCVATEHTSIIPVLLFFVAKVMENELQHREWISPVITPIQRDTVR